MYSLLLIMLFIVIIYILYFIHNLFLLFFVCLFFVIFLVAFIVMAEVYLLRELVVRMQACWRAVPHLFRELCVHMLALHFYFQERLAGTSVSALFQLRRLRPPSSRLRSPRALVRRYWAPAMLTLFLHLIWAPVPVPLVLADCGLDEELQPFQQAGLNRYINQDFTIWYEHSSQPVRVHSIAIAVCSREVLFLLHFPRDRAYLHLPPLVFLARVIKQHIGAVPLSVI